ncbi:MAG: hypothetical protein N2511_02965 [Thermodesulfovibrionales bacterium]|nr:hypothetical protein [Thermodesulfovibrionales bacterium]
MRPNNLKTKIFLDGGDPEETKEAIRLLGFLDGQTTNPTLIAKNPKAIKRLKDGLRFSKQEAMEFYRNIVEEIAHLIPNGSISVEVYSDLSTTYETILTEAEKMFSWIPNAHIKIPITKEGLKAAEIAVKENIRLNMTLCFSQLQAAAVYSATKGAKKGDVFISPFIGRLDDIGINGMTLISNIIKIYRQGDGHVEILSASVRNIKHFLCSLWLGVDIVTAPFKVLKEWAQMELKIPDQSFTYNSKELKSIPFIQVDLNQPWQSYDISHTLTESGILSFVKDWNSLIE